MITTSKGNEIYWHGKRLLPYLYPTYQVLYAPFDSSYMESGLNADMLLTRLPCQIFVPEDRTAYFLVPVEFLNQGPFTYHSGPNDGVDQSYSTLAGALGDDVQLTKPKPSQGTKPCILLLPSSIMSQRNAHCPYKEHQANDALFIRFETPIANYSKYVCLNYAALTGSACPYMHLYLEAETGM
ncbi:hypothetical protein EW146_g6140 [Bondarzewia mesenterica]|uniref:Uncharacterized protein n=1 Tax=Bondarzewia mesenterica TaxID=1095465 RepID=A0A4S4LPH4_9AGAM|nr:hypothetical protein EW146_g6140 [Bondarzewia mesenterica]